MYVVVLIVPKVDFLLLLFTDSDFMTTLKLCSRRSHNTERQRGEIISE